MKEAYPMGELNQKRNEALIELKNCTMEFPGVRALDDVNFTLLPGKCHGLVGENGAGKSTLVKCITGENIMTLGELYVQGEKIEPHNHSIRNSHKLGIEIVHQEFQLMEDMTGLENIFIGRYEKKGGLIDWKALNERANELMDFLQCQVELNRPVKYLRTAEKQIVQLAKAMLSKPKILILDELTAVLQEKDIDNIFRIIEILKKEGMGIIYISHRLGEIFQCCDTYTVLCDGRHTGSGDVSAINKAQLIKMIIGRDLVQAYPKMESRFGDITLQVKGLTSKTTAFKNIDLHVRAGEVIGLAGLLGAGKTELIHAIFGNHKTVEGQIFVKGEEVDIENPMQAIRLGIGLIPDERRLLGLNMLFDIKDNTTLPSMFKFKKRGIFQDHKAEVKAAFDINKKLQTNYYSLWQNVKTLSGGNQQKIIVAKWMLRNSEIFLLDEPTRGIDIGAKFEIYSLINDLTREGKSVILVSPELEELIGLCNRIYIMYEGNIMDMVDGERKTQEIIVNSLLGVKDND